MESGEGSNAGVYSLLYCSRATSRMSDDEIPRIIGSAWRDNPKGDITGWLMYDGGMFVQWLEGPQHRVRALMDRLADDRRHDEIVELSVVPDSPTRLFPAWSMELVTPMEILGVLEQSRRLTTDVSSLAKINRMIDLLFDGPLASLLTRPD